MIRPVSDIARSAEGSILLGITQVSFLIWVCAFDVCVLLKIAFY